MAALAFIGVILCAGDRRLRAVATTDLVAGPQDLLNDDHILAVQFGRSGNSSESVGMMDVMDASRPSWDRLHITCNPDGALATRTSPSPLKVINLPEVTHDAGFAMTSSFSTMLLTALALFDEPCDVPARFNALADQLEGLLPQFGTPRPDRAVYVGSGPLAFAAREAALKVMELTAGQTPALWDSSLGFRHGPKSFVRDVTAITVFSSPQAPTNAYDTDLVAELRAQFPDARVTNIGPAGDIAIDMPFGTAWAAPLSIASSQIDGVKWAADLGLNVDDPFTGQGTLSRVVSGVKLHGVG